MAVMNDRPLPIVRDTTGLSPWYRFRWRMRYLGLFAFGPADRAGEASPRERMKWERAVKVADAHYTQGTLPDEETILTVRRMNPDDGLK